MKTYEHTQSGTVIIVSVAVVFLFFLMLATVIPLVIIAPALLLVFALLFRSLTVEISDTDLLWYFGWGWPRRSVPLAEIVSAEPIRISFWNGWGVHYTQRGWLYNVSGYGAVAIKLRNGKQFCLGTDEPEELAAQLRTRNSKPETRN
jgi:hypothetical protein